MKWRFDYLSWLLNELGWKSIKKLSLITNCWQHIGQNPQNPETRDAMENRWLQQPNCKQLHWEPRTGQPWEESEIQRRWGRRLMLVPSHVTGAPRGVIWKFGQGTRENSGQLLMQRILTNYKYSTESVFGEGRSRHGPILNLQSGLTCILRNV